MLFQHFIYIYIYIYIFFEIFIVFINVLECSGMFRDVPECSMFLVLSTADRNAVRVDTVYGIQVGHIKRELARALADVMDNRLARLEG